MGYGIRQRQGIINAGIKIENRLHLFLPQEVVFRGPALRLRIGSEFGGRHELYEINYSGSQDEIRLQCLRQAQSSGNMDKMMAMVDRCLSEYDQNGWTVPHLHNNTDINMLDKLLK